MIESKETGAEGAAEVNEYMSLTVEESDLPCGGGFNLVASPDTISWRIASPSKGWQHVVPEYVFGNECVRHTLAGASVFADAVVSTCGGL